MTMVDTKAPGLVIAVLGAPSIERAGAPVAFDTRKAIALLAFLAVSGRPQRRETLAGLLWPTADEDHARSALRRTLSSVKQGVGSGLVVTRAEVGLAGGDGVVRTDVRDFLAGLASDDLEEVAAAAALWRGDLLAGFTLRDSSPFDEWQRVEGERLRGVLGRASARLVDGLSAAGRVDEAVGHAERWLALDPLHEPAHRALMALHARRGDRAAAVRQYRCCVRAVDEELGVAPLRETTALYEAIAAGQAVPAGGDEATTVPLPSGRYALVGRAEERAALRAAIGPGRLVVVDGEPGVGKTRLVAEALADRRPALTVRCYENDGDVPYGPIAELLRLAAAEPEASARLGSLPASCALEVGRLVPELQRRRAEPERHEPHEPASGPGAEARFLDGLVRAIIAAGRAPPGLIVIDDAQWADHASQRVLAQLLHRGGREGPCLVMTVRLGEVTDAGPLARAMADRLRTGGLHLRLDRLDLPAVTELVAVVAAPDQAEHLATRVHHDSEGLPFLVVAHLDAIVAGGVPPDGLGELLGSRLATLSDGAAQLLSAASVIGRSFAFDVVRLASGRSHDEAVGALEELIARGLVEEGPAAAGATYDFTHDQLRRHVYDHTSLARRRLLHHRVADALRRAASPSAERVVDAAIAHHERRAGHDALAAQHFRRAGDHARSVHANAEALAHYEAALALGADSTAELHEAIGDLLTLAGRFVEAVGSYERSLARAGPDDVGRLEGKLGGVHQRRGHWSTAQRHYEAALEALAPGDGGARARALADLAITARQDDGPRARRLARAAIEQAVGIDDDAALMHVGTVAGLLAVRDGDLTGARQLLERSIELAEGLGDRAALVAARNGLARVERQCGALDRADALLVDALAVCTSIGDRHREAALRDQRAQVLRDAGQLEEAMAELKRAVAIFAEIGSDDAEAIHTAVWGLSEWADLGSGPSRNDLGTDGRENASMSVPSASGSR